MPLSIVVGGQFGSEGKGKVACFLAKERQARAVVRVGGPNSGHTVIDRGGRRRIFRQLPTAAILDEPVCVIAAGAYIDMQVLRAEISQTGLTAARLKIDPKAMIITPDCKEDEQRMGLKARVGSTLTGTGAAVSRRIARRTDCRFACDEPELRRFLADTAEYLDDCLGRGENVIAEGSQGFGLSVIHTPYFPYATSRDTTAAGVLSEIGLSPLAVGEIALVIRAFPIRVPGNSGPLPRETSWEAISKEAEFISPISELTSVTRSPRRVAFFDPKIVRAAIRANRPSLLFLNHADYVDAAAGTSGDITERVESFLLTVEKELARPIDFVGFGPAISVPRKSRTTARFAA